MGAPKMRADLAKKAMAIDKVLASLYGTPEVGHDNDPLDTLVETILSQNTTDANSHRAFLALKARYPRWEDLLGEAPRTVAGIIRSGGLAEMKAVRILDALALIMRERGELDLDFLARMSPSDADSWLSRMKGVGPKTRAIVLLFSLDMPSFPVDTHVHRVTKRIGLIGPRTSREQAQIELARLVPERKFYSFHINLIEHGRGVCHARGPECPVCRVSRYCESWNARGNAQT